MHTEVENGVVEFYPLLINNFQKNNKKEMY